MFTIFLKRAHPTTFDIASRQWTIISRFQLRFAVITRFAVLKNIRRNLLVGVALCSYFLSAEVFAQESLTTPAAETEQEIDDCSNLFPGGFKAEQESTPLFFSFLDAPESAVSRRLHNFVRNVDEFFANEKTFYTSTGSYVRLTMDAAWNEGGEVGYSGDVRLKVHLPVTQGKLKLLLETDPIEKRDSLDRRIENTPRAAVDNPDYYAGIQASFGEEVKWQFSSSIGLRIRSPLDPYVRLRAERNYPLANWLLTLSGTAYWFDSSGTGYDGVIEFNRQLNDKTIGRSTSFARWTADTNYFTMSQVFSVIHSLSERRAVTYLTGVYGISDPAAHATDYLIAARYRQALYKDFLFLELNPELRFRKITEFRDEYTLFVRLELLFQD